VVISQQSTYHTTEVVKHQVILVRDLRRLQSTQPVSLGDRDQLGGPGRAKSRKLADVSKSVIGWLSKL